MKHHLALAAIALLLLTATNAHAACTRDDISFYLSNGFTPEQITAICTAAGESAPPAPTATPEPASSVPSATTEPAAPPTPVTPEAEAPAIPVTPEPAEDIAVVPPAGGKNKDAEKFLLEAIKGQDIHIDEGFLHFTAKVCIPYGRSSTNKEPWENETCELVKYKVTLRGMKAKRELISQRLFQPRQVYLEGQIERKLVSDLDDLLSAN